MADKDLFAPPSPDEIKSIESDPRFAPPTAQELQAANPEEYSKLGSAAMGLHQGAMLGFADELKGAGKAIGSAAGDIMFGLPRKDVEGYLKEYRESQQASQQDFEQAKKQNPWSYGGAQLVGGLVPGIAASPLAASAPMATAVGAGALTGAGESKGTIESDPGKLAKDAVIGGATGAALQYGLGKVFGKSGAAEAAPKDIRQRGELIPQLEEAAKAGEQGLTYSSKPAAKSALDESLKSEQNALTEAITAPRKALGEKVGAVTKGADFGDVEPMASETFDKIGDISSAITEKLPSLNRKAAADVLDKLDQFKRGLLNPGEAYELKKTISGMASEIQDPDFQSTLKSGASVIEDELSKIPGYQDAVKNFAQYARQVPEALLAKGHDPDLANVFLGDLKDQGQLKIANEIQSLLGKLRMGGEQGTKAQSQLQNMIDSMKKLSPEQLQEVGLNPDEFQKGMLSLADKFAARTKATGESVGQSAFERGKFGLRKASEAGALKAANIYGQAKRTIRDFVSSAPEDLTNDAKTLTEQGGKGISDLGKSLSDAISSKDIQKQNAVIFSILQLPKAKELLGLHTDEEK